MKMKIGHVFKILRVAQGKTQQEVASNAKVDVSYIGMLERNTRSPRLETLEKLAVALGTTSSDLMAATTCLKEDATA